MTYFRLTLSSLAVCLLVGCSADIRGPSDAERVASSEPVDGLDRPGVRSPPAMGPSAGCLNEADIAAHEGADVLADALAEARLCVAASDHVGCVVDAWGASAGLSDRCARCYGDAALCGVSTCAGECAVAPATGECLACVERHCGGTLATCAGFSWGCGNGICDATETSDGCAEDCAETAACDLDCAEGCADTTFQCGLDCAVQTAECRDDCRVHEAACLFGCGCE